METTLSMFPYQEIKDPDGNFFPSWAAAKEAGFDDDQIWSVAEGDDAWTYGPPHHYVNVLGFVATLERHDGDTYYEEWLDIPFEDDGQPDEYQEWKDYDPDC